jgi:hypothetical protein
MNRREALLRPAAAAATVPFWSGAARASGSSPQLPRPGLKVLRLASESETGFDPARIGDARSLRIT